MKSQSSYVIASSLRKILKYYVRDINLRTILRAFIKTLCLGQGIKLSVYKVKVKSNRKNLSVKAKIQEGNSPD